ncbi:GTP cyclohydrolase II [Rhizina undulata]
MSFSDLPPSTADQLPLLQVVADDAIRPTSVSPPPSLYSPRPTAAAPQTYFSSGNVLRISSSHGELADSSSSSLPMSREDSIKSFTTEGGENSGVGVPPSILSPAFTPPATPSMPLLRAGVPVEVVGRQPKLMKQLPEVNCIVRARIPTTTGTEIFLHLYQNSIDKKEHLAIVFGNEIRSTSLDAPRKGETEMDRMIRGAYTGRLYPGRTSSRYDDSPLSSRANSRPSSSTSLSSLAAQQQQQHHSHSAHRHVPLVRIHSECYTGETAWSARCDCGEQLDEAARLMSLDPAGGVIVYLRQEGRGIGLGEKLKAYNLQDLGNDTVQANLLLRHPADARSYGLATAILKDLGLAEIRLMTNNPDKIAAVEGPGKEVRVVERVPMIPLAWKNVKGGVTGREVGDYLRTKIQSMGHMLEMPEGLDGPVDG